MKKFLPHTVFALLLASQTLTQVEAQMGSPVPGTDANLPPSDQVSNTLQTNPLIPNLNQSTQPVNAPSYVSAPVPGQNQVYQGQVSQTGNPLPNSNQPQGKSRYQQLPISTNDAQMRLQELSSQITYSNLPVNALKDLQENVLELGDWLNDLTDAHYRMYMSFAKFVSTKRAAEAEKITFQNFRLLKHQAQLLKAQILIKQNRIPEALGPLVDVVTAEPQTTTGQAAYKLLKDIGFSQEAANLVPQSKPEVTSAQVPVETQTVDPPAATAPTNINSLNPILGTPPKATPKVVAAKVRRLPPAQIPRETPSQFQLRKGR